MISGSNAPIRTFASTSRRGPGASPPDGVTFSRDALTTVRELKAEDELDIYLCGGGELAGTILSEIDRLILKCNPVVFGAGIPLFGDAPYEALPLETSKTRAFESGVTIQEYTSTH